MQFRPLPVMSAATVISLVILIALGNWQWQRYEGKLGREPDEIAPAVELEFELIAPAGTMAQQVYGLADGEPIWRRYGLARPEGGGEPVLVTLNATGGPNPVPLALETAGPITGTFRLIDREGRASARNRPDEDIWYVFDRQGMLARLGHAGGPVRVAEPVELEVINANTPARTRLTSNPYQLAQPLDPLPPQRHFGYALTWWGLAAALLVMYLAYHRARGRLRF